MQDGLFKMFYRQIEVKTLNEPIYLIPIGDVHYDSSLCDRDRFHRQIAWMKTKKNCFGIGMGDYWDFAATKEGRILACSDIHDSTREVFEAHASGNVDCWHRLLSGIEWLGFLQGNHDYSFMDGTNSTTRLCARLKAPYLGTACVYRLSFRYKGGKCRTIDIYAHHGKGGGRLPGGSINNVFYMAEGIQADIYLMGHDHRQGIATQPIMVPTYRNGKMNLQQRKRYFLRTGSYLRAFVDGEKSYNVTAGRNPSSLGCSKIELTPRMDYGPKNGKQKNDLVVDIHAGI